MQLVSALQELQVCAGTGKGQCFASLLAFSLSLPLSFLFLYFPFISILFLPSVPSIFSF
jgi:hypothetical protein